MTVPHSPANNKNEGKLLHHVCGNFYTPPNHKLSKSFMPVLMQWLSDGTIEVCHSSMYVYSMFTV
jgi:hypothetical protein